MKLTKHPNTLMLLCLLSMGANAQTTSSDTITDNGYLPFVTNEQGEIIELKDSVAETTTTNEVEQTAALPSQEDKTVTAAIAPVEQLPIAESVTSQSTNDRINNLTVRASRNNSVVAPVPNEAIAPESLNANARIDNLTVTASTSSTKFNDEDAYCSLVAENAQLKAKVDAFEKRLEKLSEKPKLVKTSVPDDQFAAFQQQLQMMQMNMMSLQMGMLNQNAYHKVPSAMDRGGFNSGQYMEMMLLQDQQFKNQLRDIHLTRAMESFGPVNVGYGVREPSSYLNYGNINPGVDLTSAPAAPAAQATQAAPVTNTGLD